MIITVDVGNTDTVVGVFRDNRLVEKKRILTDRERTTGSWIRQLKGIGRGAWEGSIVASVVPHGDRALRQALRRSTGKVPLEVNARMDTGISIRIPRPKTLGADRLANAAYCHHRYGGPVVILDFGTATTVCSVSKDGAYTGGAIMPGLRLSSEALFGGTALLPRIDLKGRIPVIGKTTESAMRLGIVEGHAGAVERITMKIIEKLGKPAAVVATGGYARLMARRLPFVSRVEPDLTLKALHYLFLRNTE